jgi:hypothetical protein
MTAQQFATVSVRFLALATMTVGTTLIGGSGVLAAMSAGSVASMPTPNLHLHDAYFIVSQVEQAWLAPGVVGLLVGAVLFLCSGRLGRLMAQGMGTES